MKQLNATNLDMEKCVGMIGNRFEMILIASERARELNRGYKSKLNTNRRSISTALHEIQAGLIGREYLSKIK